MEAPSDLNVRYTLGIRLNVETEAYLAGWRGLGTRIVRVPYAQGTLAIDLRDPRLRVRKSIEKCPAKRK
jgi:hypothetical protein